MNKYILLCLISSSCLADTSLNISNVDQATQLYIYQQASKVQQQKITFKPLIYPSLIYKQPKEHKLKQYIYNEHTKKYEPN